MVVALVLTLIVVGTAQIEPEAGNRRADALAFGCGIVAALSLLGWRRWAPVVATVVALAVAMYLARDYPGGPALLPGPLSMLALGYTASRRTAWAGVVLLLVATGVGRLVAGHSLLLHEVVFLGWASAAVLAGQALAARGERAATERERVAHAHDRALAAERLRIAQDLHDSVAHAMATINVQSGVAAHLVNRRPEHAAQALEAIRTASADALDELGAILGVLRQDGAAPRVPLAGLDGVAELVTRARADGLRVTLTGVAGDVEPSPGLPATVGAAAYRVVQEALTNTRRHAGADAAATVEVDAVDTDHRVPGLRVTITDDGGRRPVSVATNDPGPVAGGFGLVGMRERVEASGGTLATGPRPAGGFRVDANWPGRP